MKKLLSALLVLAVVFAAAVGSMPGVLAVGGTYTVTYSAGAKGTFTQAYISSLSGYSVTQSANGNLKITVNAGDPTPNAPTAADVDLGSYQGSYSYKGVYVASSETDGVAAAVTENVTYVVRYNAVVSGVEYSVRYVDAATGADIATPVISVGNTGDSMNFTAKNITGYAYGTFTNSIVLNADGTKNAIVFQYTSAASGTTTTTTTAAATTTTATTETTTSAANTNTNTETSAETTTANDTTAANDTTVNSDTSEVTINDNNVPLAQNNGKSSSGTVWYWVGGGVAVAGLAAWLIIAAAKRKKSK